MVNRGDIWQVKGTQDGRTVCVDSLDGLDETSGACLAIVLHPPGAYPGNIGPDAIARIDEALRAVLDL
ncbi:hypothetical protein ABZ471_23850 [Streptomyces sp. NPDC005728]|uniref:hypothetical protein n=1 Tax=Streptomyces sp. NPDC005728 TaxID=3157054 RepID=UPI0034024818